MKDKFLKEEIRAAKKTYDDSGAIVDFMRYDYLRRGIDALNVGEGKHER